VKIDWKRKLSSRKFWALLAAFIISILLITGADAGTVEKVTGAITALGGIITYILAEAKVDVAREKE